MRCFCLNLFCPVVLIFPLCASGLFNGQNRLAVVANKTNKQHAKSKKNNYSGMHICIGANLELQRMSTGNKNFRDSPASIETLRYGGNFSLSYVKRFCRNLYAGVAVGVDISGGRNEMWRGGVLSLTSEIAHQNLIKRDLLRNLLGLLSSRMIVDPPNATMGDIFVSEFTQLTDYVHYLGGTNRASPQLPAFIGSGVSTVFDRMEVHGASLSSSSTPMIAAVDSLRDFVSDQFPIVYKILGNVASNGVRASNDIDCFIPDPSGQKLSQSGSEIFSELFRGNPLDKDYYCYTYLEDASQILPLGLLPDDPNCTDPDLSSDQKQLSTALRAINDMYYNDDALLAPPGVDANALKNKFHTTTSFDVCPHISLQLGYYFKELRGMMYTKVGAMELNGRATIVCDTDNVYTEKFKKWAPFVAVGFNKNLTENFGFAFELAQTFKAKEKLPTIRLFNRYKIDESVTLSRTIFRATLTYRLPHSRN